MCLARTVLCNVKPPLGLVYIVCSCIVKIQLCSFSLLSMLELDHIGPMSKVHTSPPSYRFII